jgi:hypothetical protein
MGYLSYNLEKIAEAITANTGSNAAGTGAGAQAAMNKADAIAANVGAKRGLAGSSPAATMQPPSNNMPAGIVNARRQQARQIARQAANQPRINQAPSPSASPARTTGAFGHMINQSLPRQAAGYGGYGIPTR